MQYSEKYVIQRFWGDKTWWTDSEHDTEHEAWNRFDQLGDWMEKGSIRVIRTTEVVIATRSKA